MEMIRSFAVIWIAACVLTLAGCERDVDLKNSFNGYFTGFWELTAIHENGKTIDASTLNYSQHLQIVSRATIDSSFIYINKEKSFKGEIEDRLDKDYDNLSYVTRLRGNLYYSVKLKTVQESGKGYAELIVSEIVDSPGKIQNGRFYTYKLIGNRPW